MGEAKKIIVKTIASKDANRLCKLFHYSGKVMTNSQLHFGVFYNDRCEGVMSFGISVDKRRMAQNLKIGVDDFLELNRMAFSDRLPRNSESRAISFAHKFIKDNYKRIKLIVSFSDATQCGDGIIYRASGYKLLDIKKNNSIVELSDAALAYVQRFIPNAERIITKKSLDNHMDGSKYLSSTAKKYGYTSKLGFQLKYIYCLDTALWEKYNFLPFSKIDEYGARMYKGEKKMRHEHESNASGFQLEKGGAIPTVSLQSTR